MMANQTIVHVQRVRFEEMNWNNVQRQENQSAQMVEQKDRHVVHFLLSPPEIPYEYGGVIDECPEVL